MSGEYTKMKIPLLRDRVNINWGFKLCKSDLKDNSDLYENLIPKSIIDKYVSQTEDNNPSEEANDIFSKKTKNIVQEKKSNDSVSISKDFSVSSNEKSNNDTNSETRKSPFKFDFGHQKDISNPEKKTPTTSDSKSNNFSSKFNFAQKTKDTNSDQKSPVTEKPTEQKTLNFNFNGSNANKHESKEISTAPAESKAFNFGGLKFFE